jgi:hypothetical protein
MLVTRRRAEARSSARTKHLPAGSEITLESAGVHDLKVWATRVACSHCGSGARGWDYATR